MGVQVAMARLAAMRMFPVFELDWHGNKAPVAHAAPRNNVIGNVLNRSRSPPQHGRLRAAIMVERHVHRWRAGSAACLIHINVNCR